MADLNVQAKNWALTRFAERPLSKSALIPRELFELEKAYLVKLNGFHLAPYRNNRRNIDKSGFIAFNGNYYWIPEGIKGMVEIVEYETKIAVYQKHQKLIEYVLPAWNVKNTKFTPKELKQLTRQPNNRKKGCGEEEKKLRQSGEAVGCYLDFILSQECRIKQKPQLIRGLHRLSKKVTAELFTRCIQRALKYRVTSLKSVEKIAGSFLAGCIGSQREIPASDDYENRSTYQQGRISGEEDLRQYCKQSEEDEHE